MSTIDDGGNVRRLSLALRVVAWARARLAEGYEEATGHNDGSPATRFAGGREEKWCAHFVACAFRECAAPIPGDVVPTRTRANPLCSVTVLERVFREHDWHHTEPRPGDLVFLKGHVGIVERVTDYYVVSIEGNTGNAVARVTRERADERITGYGRRPEIT